MAEIALQEGRYVRLRLASPPLLAIGLAIYTRQVFLSLAAGIWLGHTILSGWNPAAGAAGAIDGAIGVLGDAGNARVIVFTFLIGALIATVEANGGHAGLRALGRGSPLGDERPARPDHGLADRDRASSSNRISRSSSRAPCRGPSSTASGSRERNWPTSWTRPRRPSASSSPSTRGGALVLGILTEQGVANPLGVFLVAIPLNLYAVAALVLAGLTAFRGWNWGPMKKAEARTRDGRLHWDHAVALADPEEIARRRPRASRSSLATC